MYPYYWRVKTRLPGRYGQKCRVLVWGRRNSRLIEFEDGFRVVSSGNFIRRRCEKDRTESPDAAIGVGDHLSGGR